MKFINSKQKLGVAAFWVIGLLTTVNSYAASTASQNLTITVSAIDEISVSGDPGALVINGSTLSGGAGSSSAQVTDATTTYSVSTNSVSNKKITAEVDSAIGATGMSLEIQLASSSGSSAGFVDITSASSGSAADVVTDLSQAAETGETISYRATATLETPIGTVSPVVTLTVAAQ